MEGACLDLDLSVEIGVCCRSLGLNGGAGGGPGGGPWSVDIGVMILVAMDWLSVIVTSSSSVCIGKAGGLCGG